MLLRRSCPALFLLALIAAPAAYGQAANSPVAFVNQEAITTSFVPTPSVGSATATGSGENNQWLKVEFHYGTTDKLTTKFLDSIEFKVWIEGLDPLAKNSQGTLGVGVALTGSVTYINVPAGKDIYGVFYVHPSTLARYSGDRGYEDYDRKFDVHLQALVGGAVMDEINKNKEQDPLGWYKPLTVVTGLVYRQDQCPFMLADPDKYPAIKLPAPAQ
jgi:hypothetical protein